MTRYSRPVWQMLLEALDELDELTTRNAIEWIGSHYGNDQVKHATIRDQLIAASVNHPSAHHYEDKHRFLFYSGQGRYRRYDANVDGVWQFTPTGVKKLQETESGALPFARIESGNRITVPMEITKKLRASVNDIIAFVYENDRITLRKAELKLFIP